MVDDIVCGFSRPSGKRLQASETRSHRAVTWVVSGPVLRRDLRRCRPRSRIGGRNLTEFARCPGFSETLTSDFPEGKPA